jgi:hypothetical protein
MAEDSVYHKNCKGLSGVLKEGVGEESDRISSSGLEIIAKFLQITQIQNVSFLIFHNRNSIKESTYIKFGSSVLIW